MAPVMCRKCRALLTPEEARAGTCPLCGDPINPHAGPITAEWEVPGEDGVQAPPASTGIRWLVWAAVAILVAAAAGLAFYAIKLALFPPAPS